MRSNSTIGPGPSLSDKYESSNASATNATPGTPPRDYEWEAYQQHVEVDGSDAWESLPAEPEETNDDVFEDENDEEDQIATDLTIRIGRMIICENVTGFFRPQYAEEVLFTFDYILPAGFSRLLRLSVVAWEASFGASYFDFIRGWSESTAIIYAVIRRADAVSCAIAYSALGIIKSASPRQ